MNFKQKAINIYFEPQRHRGHKEKHREFENIRGDINQTIKFRNILINTHHSLLITLLGVLDISSINLQFRIHI